MTNTTLKNKAKKLSPAFSVAYELVKHPTKYCDNEQLIEDLVTAYMLDLVLDDYDYDVVTDIMADLIEDQLTDTELEEYIDEIFDLIS